MADIEALQTELNELYSARTKLLTGSKMVSGGFKDRRWEYNQVDMDRLEARIRTLEGELGIGANRRRRPIGVIY